MKYVKIFEDYSAEVSESTYSAIPVFNELEFRKNINTKPEMNVKYSEVAATLKDLLKKKEMGGIEEIVVIAEVPTQGKGAPDYVKDIIAQERERIARKIKAQRGIDIDDDREGDFDFDVDRFGNQRTIYFDSEFIVDRVETIDGKEYVIGIPVSLKGKGYEAKIAPIKIEEIYFTPKK
jgi:hypothetical protein